MQNPQFARPKTSYRKLNVYKKAEAIYDLTYLFLEKHISKKDRTYDQMLQAARSGKQNIVEGRFDAAISAEMEIKLFGVARGSLHELLNDYEDFMRTRNIPIWPLDFPRSVKLRELCKTQNESSYYISLAPRLRDEEFCNMMLTLLNQELRMLDKFIELIKAIIAIITKIATLAAITIEADSKYRHYISVIFSNSQKNQKIVTLFEFLNHNVYICNRKQIIS